MLADRVGVVEGIVGDLAHGHIPNIPQELGLQAEWKHNRKGLSTKIIAGTILICAAVSYLRRSD
jgi:hypothetical protein